MTNKTHKITNRKTGATLEGDYRPRQRGLAEHIDFKVAGTRSYIALRADEWDLEEIKPPVPTVPGFYHNPKNNTLATVRRLNERGEWTGYDGLRLASFKRADLPANLVRLVPEITEVTDEMVIAFEDNSRGDGPLRESRRAGLLAAIKVAQNG